MRRIIVTGGAGFIGSALVRRLIASEQYVVLNLDKLTYAAAVGSLRAVEDNPRYSFVQADITDAATVRNIFATFQPDGVIHLAAESHVDRSIDRPESFLQTNVVGTCVLLMEALRFLDTLDSAAAAAFRFHHVSTDEVFGALGQHGAFRESDPYCPSSPYAASKAAADHFVRAWSHTFGLPVVISNCSNNYGPFQYPEKLIPLVIIKCWRGEPIPVYGSGTQVRDWLHVDDHAQALQLIFEKGRPGESYNVGGASEKRNLDVVEQICDVVDQQLDRRRKYGRNLIQFVTDRPGHDFRYAINFSKLAKAFGWRPLTSFEQGLEDTVKWYLQNTWWWESIGAQNYDGQRLGLLESRAV